MQAVTSAGGEVAMRSGRFRSVGRGAFHSIAFTDWGDRAAPRVAICVHGLTRQGRDFDVLAQALAREGWRVVCPDLVGRGRSDWLKDPDDYALSQYVVDMTALIAHLGVEAVDWIGTSLGGLVGMMMAARQRTPVRSLAINDIGPFLHWQPMLDIGRNVRAAPRRHPTFRSAVERIREVHAPFGPLTDAQWEHLARYSYFESADGGWIPHFDPGIGETFRLGRVFSVGFWREWDAIACPTLVLRGELSELLWQSTAAEMTQRGPRPRLVEIAGCGHAPALMDPAEIAIVLDWMKAVRRDQDGIDPR